MATVLLDTNVLIELEDPGRPLSASSAEMLRNASSEIDFFIHPDQRRDIARDHSKDRRWLFSSRIARYRVLDKPPCFSDEYFSEKGWVNNSDNDRIDNTLLACVVEPIVDYLVTNDKGILAKAARTDVKDRVLSLRDFESLINKQVDTPDFAFVRDEPCHALDASESFFDSLRQSYGVEVFNNWLEKCARQQRRCWTVRQDERLRALCIYKDEESEIIDNAGFKPRGSVLKLCTFKVDSDLQGSKIGERLLHKAFSYGQAKSVDFLYLTVKEGGNRHLLSLLEDFGFERFGLNPDGDRVIGKYLRAQTSEDEELDKAEYCRRFYPSYKRDSTVRKYLVPIGKSYHEQLFPDVSDFYRKGLFGDLPEMYGPESNTIRKAYLCGSSIRKIEAGDLLLFYRSEDKHSIEVLGVVKEARRLINRDEIYELVKRRTVYSLLEIGEWVNNHPEGVLVICFDLIGYFNNPVDLDKLRKMGLSHPQSIYGLSDDVFDAIMEAGQ